MSSTITIAGIIMGVMLVFTVNSVQASELGMPDIVMNSESGPVGSMITINVSNLPMPPDDADPRLEFYMYLPASEKYGSNLTNCEGQCVILYSFDDIRNEKVSTKEITFALPSVRNPDPTSVQLYQYDITYGTKVGAKVYSICDIVINEIVEYQNGYSCNNYDVPVGKYEISFGWVINNSDVGERQTITFTVTDEPYQFKGISNNVTEISPEDLVNGSSETIFKKFEQGSLLASILGIVCIILAITVLNYFETQNSNYFYLYHSLKSEKIVSAFKKQFEMYAFTIQYDVVTNEPIKYISIIDDGWTAELIFEKDRIVFNCYGDYETYLTTIINPQPKDIDCSRPRF